MILSKGRFASIGTTTWDLAVGVYSLLFRVDETKPSNAGPPADSWPRRSRIPRDPNRANLLMFLDPDCPCGRTSLAELGRIAVRCAGRAAVRAIILGDEGEAGLPGGAQGAHEAGAPGGVTVIRDWGGAEARRFGAATSGQVLLFDPDGRLRFSGGITPSHGDEGNRYASDAVITLIADPAATARRHSPIFGCPLTPSGASRESEAGRGSTTETQRRKAEHGSLRFFFSLPLCVSVSLWLIRPLSKRDPSRTKRNC